MDFYYDPILGLQFTCGLSIFEIDLDALPEVDFSLEKWFELISEQGIQIFNPANRAITNIHTKITSNLLE